MTDKLHFSFKYKLRNLRYAQCVICGCFVAQVKVMLNISKIWLIGSEVWIRISDGREGCEPFARYSRLQNAIEREQTNYECTPMEIHWPLIDEDLCYEGFLK